MSNLRNLSVTQCTTFLQVTFCGASVTQRCDCQEGRCQRILSWLATRLAPIELCLDAVCDKATVEPLWKKGPTRPFFTEQLDKALCRSLLATRYSSREPSKHPSGEHPPIIQHRWRQRLSQQSTVDAVPNGGTGETFGCFKLLTFLFPATAARNELKHGLSVAFLDRSS